MEDGDAAEDGSADAFAARMRRAAVTRAQAHGDIQVLHTLPWHVPAARAGCSAPAAERCPCPLWALRGPGCQGCCLAGIVRCRAWHQLRSSDVEPQGAKRQAQPQADSGSDEDDEQGVSSQEDEFDARHRRVMAETSAKPAKLRPSTQVGALPHVCLRPAHGGVPAAPRV